MAVDVKTAEAVIATLRASRLRPRAERDVTTFLMDRDLLVCGAAGDSILRLPWFDEELFVGQQLPDIAEIPDRIRAMAIDSYRSALAGEHSQYAFTSYGLGFSVDAVPVKESDGTVAFALAIAVPGRSFASAVAASEKMSERLYREADAAEARAAEQRRRGRRSAALSDQKRAQSTRQSAERAELHAERLRAQATHDGKPPELTPRELDVLALSSHGLSYTDIAKELVLTPATVKTHLANVYAKLGVADKTAAVAFALRHGLIE